MPPTTTATAPAITQTTAALRRLGDRVGGRLLLPDGPGYDEARTVWNAMIDRRPLAIVRCASVDDVVHTVRAAHELGLEIGVRCGGHSVVGLPVPDGGIMIDLRPLAGVSVDPVRRRAKVGGGALLGALDDAAQRYGLATTAGNVSHTGVGGLTLGGGMGWLARQYGLACDNVVGFEMVTAAGDVVRADRDTAPELFWALRGGGGNFGVVTEFEFQLHPVGTRALSVRLSFDLDHAGGVLAAWRDMAADAPRRATFDASISRGRLGVGFVWVGDPAMGRRLLPALRALGRPAATEISELSYLDLQRREDGPQGHAYRRYWKGHYLHQLPDSAIDALVRSASDPQDCLSPGISLQAYGGAIADVADEESAFSHRDTLFEYVAATRWTDPAEDADRMAAARRAAGALDPFASGAYVNALSDEGQAGVRRAYPPRKLARLTAVKDAYDPDNVFHLNHNIRPSIASTTTASTIRLPGRVR